MNRIRARFAGTTDIVDSRSTRYTAELLKRFPSMIGDKITKRVLDFFKGKEASNEGSFTTDIIWPIYFGKEISGMTIKELVDYLFDNTEWETQSKMVTTVFNRFDDGIELIKKDNLTKKSSEAIKSGLSAGRRVVVSRVLESKVKNFYTLLPDAIEEGRSKGTPLLDIRLSPIESHIHTGKQESDRIHKILVEGGDINTVASLGRGISSVSNITQLRHLWLYMGTIAATMHICREWPENVVFRYGPAVPTARDTFVLDGENIITAHFSQLFAYTVGLDSDGYLLKREGIENLGYKILSETNNPQSKEFAEDDFAKMFETAKNLENDILQGNELGTKLEELAKTEKFKSQTSNWIDTNSPLEELKSLSQPLSSYNDNRNILHVIEKISDVQDTVESILAESRKSLEPHYSQVNPNI